MRRLPFDPYFDKGMRGWIVNTARRHYWRVAAWHGLDDLIQEGLLSYAICRQRYWHKVKNKRHAQALVKIVFMNRITDLANERTAGDDVAISQIAAEGRENEALEFLAGGFEGDAEMRVALASAPDEIKQLLRLMSDPIALDKLKGPLRRYPGGLRETTSQRLARMIGCPEMDFEALLREVLNPEPRPEKDWANWFAKTFDEMDSPIYRQP